MLVIPAGITPLLIFKRQMDVDEETEVRSLAEEDEVILSQSVVKRIKAEHSNQRHLRRKMGRRLGYPE